MDRLTQKCSTIFIAIGERTRVFHSVEEIPPKLRERLIETTHGMNSATILIADKGGREEILRAVRDDQPARYARLAAALGGRTAGHRRFVLTWAGLGRLLVLGSLGYVLWFLINFR